MRLVRLDEPSPPAEPPHGEHRGPSRRGRARLWGIATLMAVVAVGTVIDYQIRERLPTPPVVMLEPITKGGIAGTIRASGTLEPVETAIVSQPITGKLVEVPVAVGDRVERGQVVARFDPLALRAELVGAEARLVAAQADAFEAEVVLGGVMRDGSPGPSYKGPFQDDEALVLDDARAIAEARAASARAAMVAREAEYLVAQRRMGQRVVRAPSGGVVLARDAHAGETLIAGAPIVRIAADMNRLHLVADLPEAEVARVARGQSARFTVPAFPGRTFEGRVTGKGPLGGPQGARRFPVLLIVENRDGALQARMSASLALETRSDGHAFRVPVAALGFHSRQWSGSKDEPSIWLAQEPGAPLVRVPVVVGVSDETYAEVRAPGLREGAAVAVAYARPVSR